ncbi:hypothetical protein BB776_00900 [Planococcus salinarum]|uniref:Uncharacterized protein n=1 Tax=Planococcus salinarum TaxID=622695 RepID=A0ABX3CYI2_9BACL|nr:hypothetical protein BB776_00900 [Planococcus salinarum]
MLITVNGVLIRMDVNDISTTGRSTQGVRLIRLSEDEIVATVAKVKKDIDLPEPEEEGDDELLIEEMLAQTFTRKMKLYPTMQRKALKNCLKKLKNKF